MVNPDVSVAVKMQACTLHSQNYILTYNSLLIILHWYFTCYYISILPVVYGFISVKISGT